MAGATRSVPDVLPTRLWRIAWRVFEWIPILIVVILWELASGWAVPERMLPGPMAVSVEVVDMLQGDLPGQLWISLYRVGTGLALSITVGVLLGIGMARIRSIENFFDVFLAMLYPVPKTGLVPLAMLWFGRGTQMAIFIIFLACLLPIILNTYNAATSVDETLIWSAQMMGTSDRQILRKVVLPDAIPGIVTGIRQSIPFAFIALIGAEFIGAGDGVGHVIEQTGQLGLYPRMFAAIVVISATAFFTLRAFEQLERRVIRWT